MLVDEIIGNSEAVLSGIRAHDVADGEPRWQATMDVEGFVASDPEKIWPFVARWGCHPDEEIRTAVGVCLLEELLELHFELVFPLVRAMTLTDAHFADTLLESWKSGQAEHPEDFGRVDELVLAWHSN